MATANFHLFPSALDNISEHSDDHSSRLLLDDTAKTRLLEIVGFVCQGGLASQHPLNEFSVPTTGLCAALSDGLKKYRTAQHPDAKFLHHLLGLVRFFGETQASIPIAKLVEFVGSCELLVRSQISKPATNRSLNWADPEDDFDVDCDLPDDVFSQGTPLRSPLALGKSTSSETWTCTSALDAVLACVHHSEPPALNAVHHGHSESSLQSSVLGVDAQLRQAATFSFFALDLSSQEFVYTSFLLFVLMRAVGEPEVNHHTREFLSHMLSTAQSNATRKPLLEFNDFLGMVLGALSQVQRHTNKPTEVAHTALSTLTAQATRHASYATKSLHTVTQRRPKAEHAAAKFQWFRCFFVPASKRRDDTGDDSAFSYQTRLQRAVENRELGILLAQS